jgi:hypothetical protein
LASHKELRQRQANAIVLDLAALRESHRTAPDLVRFVGLPFYYGHIAQYYLRLVRVQQSEYVQNLQKRWETSKTESGNRTQIIIIAIVYFSGLLLIAALIRAINAAALSLNAFVTLGYGEIQAIGLARYLAVIEGALGWFLLSIFSVSLISQILQ